MAYPWSANDILTAADLNAAINTGIVSTGLTLSTYTPVVVQSNTPTLTVETAKYHTVAGMTHVVAHVAITGTGTANNAIRISLPVASNSYRCQGIGMVYDASAGTYYSGAAIFVTTTTVEIRPNGVPALGATSSSMTAALASGDVVSINLQYV